MTFLQPWVLLGLPLVFLPIIIHLLNRLRHRPKPWAAMRFLVSATRSSVSQTRLRQFLILLFRVLAVAMLLLFLARPLAGGWLGWALSPAPDAIVILLDRSASMETSAGGTSRRQHARRLQAVAARPFEQTTHLVWIDSATRSASGAIAPEKKAELASPISPLPGHATPPRTFPRCCTRRSIGSLRIAPGRRRFGSPPTISGAIGCPRTHGGKV